VLLFLSNNHRTNGPLWDSRLSIGPTLIKYISGIKSKGSRINVRRFVLLWVQNLWFEITAEVEVKVSANRKTGATTRITTFAVSLYAYAIFWTRQWVGR